MDIRTRDTDELIQLSDALFDCEFKEHIVHTVLSSCLQQNALGTKAQKNRSRVRGGGAKPWRQKGTGRARAGTIRSPIWRGGGKVFATEAGTVSARKKINRKEYRLAIRSIFSELLRQERFVVVSQLTVENHKTKSFLSLLDHLKLPKDRSKLLCIVGALQPEIGYSARNLVNKVVCEPHHLYPINLIEQDTVVVDVPALQEIEARLG